MSAYVLTHRKSTLDGVQNLRESEAIQKGGCTVTVTAWLHTPSGNGRTQIARHAPGAIYGWEMSAMEARDLALELLACSAAIERAHINTGAAA